MHEALIRFTDEEFNALLRYSSSEMYDPALYNALCRKIIIEHLVIAGLLSKEDVAKKSFALHASAKDESPAKTPSTPRALSDARVRRELTIPGRMRAGTETATFKALKWLINTMVTEGRFHSFTAGDLAQGIRTKEDKAYSTLNGLASQAVPWLSKKEDGGRVYWSFTEQARTWIGKNNVSLVESGIVEDESDGR